MLAIRCCVRFTSLGQHCGHESLSFEPCWEVSLPIPGGTGRNRSRAKTPDVTLEECFYEFTKKERLEGVLCDNCKKNRTQVKGMSIQILPEVLVLHLVRFDQTGRFGTKITSNVQCPIEGLSVGQFCAAGASGILDLHLILTISPASYVFMPPTHGMRHALPCAHVFRVLIWCLQFYDVSGLYLVFVCLLFCCCWLPSAV